MGKCIKTAFCCFVLLFCGLSLFPSNPISNELEDQLITAQGAEKIQILLSLSKKHFYKSPLKTIQFGNEAVRLLDTFPNPAAHAEILIYMSRASMFLGEHNKALDYANKSEHISRKRSDHSNAAWAVQSIGLVYLSMGQYESALTQYNKALNTYKRIEDFSGQGRTYILIGDVYKKRSNYPQAINYLFKALEIFTELNDKRYIAAIQNNIGGVYWNARDFDKSLELYQSSLKISKELDDKVAIATKYNNIGLVYYTKKDYKEALRHQSTSLKIANEAGLNTLMVDVLSNIGSTYIKLKDYNQAIGYFKRSKKIIMQLNDKKRLANLFSKMAPAKRGLGQYNQAINDTQKALEIGKEIKTKKETSEAYIQLSTTYEALGDYKKALEYYKNFKEIQDTIFNEENTNRIANLEASFEIERQEKEIELLKKDKQIQLYALVFVIIVAVLVIILTFSIYARYRLKVKSERELRESEEKFRVLAEQAVVGIRIIRDNTVQYANPVHLLNFGYTWDEMIGINPVDLAIPEDRPLVSEHLDKRLSGGDDAMAYEFRGRNKTGKLISLESYGALTLYQGKPAILETVIDITERKKVEQELLKHRKLKSVGILAGGIAHDFNNLLTVIIGNIGMAKMSISEVTSPKSHELLERAESASYQATDLAQKFITFSEGGWFAPRKVTLIELLNGIIDLYPDLDQCQYNISFPENLNKVYGDERQIKEVLLNLLLNARDAIPHDDKKISVSGENFDIYSGNEFLLDPGSYVKVSITDNGTGIPDDQIEKIFDPYFSTKNEVSKKGLGLGLAICYSIMKRHKGHISVSSEMDKGSTFEVYFPTFRHPDKSESIVA